MIGIDIEDIHRFEGKDKISDRTFLDKIFTQNEIDYSYSKTNYASHLTARFCAKEAAIKALSSIGINNVYMRQIEVYNDTNLCPRIRFLNPEITVKIDISLSHEKDKAIAVAIIDAKSINNN